MKRGGWEMERKRNRLPKSFARRIIKVWFGGVLVPLLVCCKIKM